MKKRNKPAIALAAILMLLGILLILAGFYGNWFFGLFAKSFDPRNIKPEDLGKSVKTDIFVYYDNIDYKDKSTQFVGNINTGEGAFMFLNHTGLNKTDRNTYYSSYAQHITIYGTLRAMDDAEFKEMTGYVCDLFIPIYRENPDPRYTEDEYKKMLVEKYIPYCIDVKSVGSFNWAPFIPTGIIVFLFAVVLEICLVFKLKKRVVLPLVYGLMIVAPAVMLFNHGRTMLSVKKVADGLYTMENIECTDTQGMLDSGSQSVTGLINWIFDRHFYGVRVNFNKDNFRIGCSAFAATTPEGEHLLARNFDYSETDTVLVHSHPKGCYESIGLADLGVLGVGQTYQIKPDTVQGRLYSVITPYLVVDGMNEKGVGAGILELTLDETHQDTGKPDLLIYCAIRGILDKSASVDEALKFLESYDIQSDLKTTYHLFITDKSGRYVVVEWLDNKMVVVEKACCANSVVAPGKYYGQGESEDKMSTMEACLGSERVVNGTEAMAILEKVSNRMTEWSCVYNLDNFSVSICMDGDYSKVYAISAKDLK